MGITHHHHAHMAMEMWGGRNNSHGRWNIVIMFMWSWEGTGGRNDGRGREKGDIPYGILPPFLNEGKGSDREGEEKPAVDVEPSAIRARTPHKRVLVMHTPQEYAS